MVTKAKKALLASLAAFLCVMLTVFGLSMSVSTAKIAKADDTTAVAQIGETKYAKLSDAVTAAAEGDTVTLIADATEDVGVDKNITLDLGGKTLTGTNTKKITLTIAKNATATVKNGSVKGTSSNYTIQNNGTATFEDLTATAGNTGSSMIDNWGTLTINSGTYTGGMNTVKSEEGSKLTINGGKFKNSFGKKWNYTATILVYGDTLITGGEFIQETTNKSSYAKVVMTGVVDGYTSITKVTGGSFTSTLGIFWAFGKATSDNFEVSGGTFNKSVPDSYFADGFIPTKNADGTFGVKAAYVAEVNGVKYKTLQEAIGAAPRNAIVTLLADTRENVTITQMYITLDLNGHTINGGTVNGKPAVTVTARVTIKDSSEAQTGTIMREDTEANSGVSSHYVIDVQGAGWLTFESGNVKNNSGNVEGKGASLVRVGDDSVAKYPGLNIKGGTFTQDNFIVIKVDCGDLFLNGGTLNSTNSYAIENWHRATVKGGTVNGNVAAWTYSGGLNSTLDILGGTIIGNVTSVNYGNTTDKKAKVSITDGTVTGTLSTNVYINGEYTETEETAKATIEVSGGTFSADPTKYVVEESAITENADGTFGVKKAYLAKVGETSYYTMDEAFKAQTASGEAIVMLRDYTTGSTFNSGSINREVDLNGHTWTCTSTDMNSAAFEINYANVTLTVKNGKIISTTLVGLIPSAMGGTITYDNAGLVFDGVTMTSNGSSGIETNGNNTNDSVTLKNSTLNVSNGFGIYFPSSGTLTIDNSTINAKTMGVQVCSGELNINAGSAITVTGDAVPKTENDGAIQDGAAISIVNRAGYKGLSNIVITGGTFTAKGENKAIKAYDWTEKTESTFTLAEKVAVSGGAFTSAVPAEYCADGFIPTQNADGTYGVKEGTYVAEVNGVKYETLQAAFEAARVGTSKVVTLLADYTATEKGGSNPGVVYDITGVTFDLGGHKFSASNFAVVFAGSNGVIQNGEMICLNGSYALFIGDEIETKGFTASNLTLTGGINVYNATMVVLDNLTVNGTNYYAVWADEHASITIESGTYTAGDVAVLSGAVGLSTINVTGGTFITNDKPLMGDSKATLQISGGTFSSEVEKDYLAKGYRLTKTGESYGVTKKYIASSTVSLGVDLSFKYEMVKGKSVDRVVASYYKVNETEATEYELTNVTIDDVVYYVFNGITPQMIDRKISVNVYVGNTVIYDVVEYSILDNLGAVLKKELGSKQDVTRQLVASLAYYGKAAMEYVKYDSSAVQKFIDDNKLTQLTAEIKDGVVAEYNSNETKVARISVQFADTNKVLVGVDEKVFDNYNYTIMVNGQEITSIDWQTGVVSGYNVYVSEGFAARYITDASKYVEVEVLDKNNNNNRVQYVKYNVAGYCMMMEANATMGALATATYNYGVAAANYAA